MADKRKNNGGVRPGAGRPKKADEERVSSLVKSAIIKTFGSEEGIWEKLASIAYKAKTDRDKIAAITKLLEYGYGKPTQTIDIDGDLNFSAIKPIEWSK